MNRRSASVPRETRKGESAMARSVEEKVEEHFKALLDDLGIRHFGKNEEINS